MQRTIFIGDLHGIYDETLALLKKCQVTAQDRVIFLGDYVDRGPENGKCCDLVREREQIQGTHAGILGNHEDKHIFYEDYLAHYGVLPERVHTGHIMTRSQLKPEHHSWFKTLPTFIRVPEYNVAAVHAGVFPGRPLEAQDRRHLLHVQMLQTHNKHGQFTNTQSLWPSKAPNKEWKFWTHFWDGPETIIFGHSVFDRPLLTSKAIGLDLGGVFGRKLCAYVLPEQQIITVDSEFNCAPQVNANYMQLIDIHDGVKAFS